MARSGIRSGSGRNGKSSGKGKESCLLSDIDMWPEYTHGDVSHMAKATSFAHFTISFDEDRGCRVVAPQHYVIAFPVRGHGRQKYQTALLRASVVQEDKIPRDPNVPGPVANHLRYKPSAERRAIPGADQYVEFELLSRLHEVPAQQPLRITTGPVHLNKESGHKEFLCVEFSQCVQSIATDILDNHTNGQRVQQNRWWICIETLRLLCAVKEIDCSALDKASASPLEWAIQLVDARVPVNDKEVVKEAPQKDIEELMDFIDGGPNGKQKKQSASVEVQKLIVDAEAPSRPAKVGKKKKNKGTAKNDPDSIDKSKPSQNGIDASISLGSLDEYNSDKEAQDPFIVADQRCMENAASIEVESSNADCLDGEFESSSASSVPVFSERRIDVAPTLHRELSQSSTATSAFLEEEELVDTSLMTELLGKYQRLKDQNLRLEIDTKIATVRGILDVFDELDEARRQCVDTQARSLFGTVANTFQAKLRGLGLERMDVVGQRFDPKLHRAMSPDAEEQSSCDQEAIAEELLSGWILGETVVRQALVVVGKA
eukprot:CAMPEP_0169323920 /NCGR_PEP_ID=MMETSP1017-20121227/10202_1 /TAXON_ID=342587 /ORGANISM="Karlodinium micrum, Strain CCMP2283" /LENGTH=544 /DNA_ID=CAMNT_0009418545 /DNA_START=45 /DNA_END=1680 /DNA_ORIENTATION=+